MMITQTPQTAPAMLSYADAQAQADADYHTAKGITAAAARTIADAFKSPRTPALLALAQGTDVDLTNLAGEARDEWDALTRERRYAHDTTEHDANMRAVSALEGWALDQM